MGVVVAAAETKRSRQRRVSRKRPAAAVKRFGYLRCNSWPWSVLHIDGRRVRGTPLRVQVAAGKHRLKFVNRELGLSKEVTVTVGPGATETVVVTLQ